MQKRAIAKEQNKEPTHKANILDNVFKGRAWEVFNAASSQFPDGMAKIKDGLESLVLDGKISEIGGEQLYAFLREIGLSIRLNTTIQVLNHGKTQSLSEKFKERTKCARLSKIALLRPHFENICATRALHKSNKPV